MEAYLVLVAMFAYAGLTSFAAGQSSFWSGLLVGTFAYFVLIYLYYGIAVLALNRRNTLLWVGGIAAFVTAYMLSGAAGLWNLLTGWSMLLFAGVIMGRLTLMGRSQHRIYLIGLVVVSVFAVAHYLPYWQPMMTALGEFISDQFAQARENLVAMGYGADAVRENLGDSERMSLALVKLVPSMTVLAAILPFSLGYLVFNYRLRGKGYFGPPLAPFIHWKIPFGVTPLLIVAILMRILGSGAVAQAADNLLLFLSLFYCLAGLALVEFYLRKLNLVRALKIAFYIFLFLTQLIGFFVAALLGFIDSFVDWRKVQRLSLAQE
ncbi:MAG: DUF2232 domain-containing protein [Candidatus Zixiibacteriota bacterium]|nr:MAG: DUF2232 domain-containing protein [candidate division Zixibacteria bacterium]